MYLTVLTVIRSTIGSTTIPGVPRGWYTIRYRKQHVYATEILRVSITPYALLLSGNAHPPAAMLNASILSQALRMLRIIAPDGGSNLCAERFPFGLAGCGAKRFRVDRT